MRRLVFIAGSATILMLCMLHCVAATIYSVQPLGIPPGYDGSEATDINNNGTIICMSLSATDISSYIWSQGDLTDLSGQGIYANAGINNKRQTAGLYTDTTPNWRFEPLIRNADGTENRLHVPDGVSNAWVHQILDDSSIYATYEYRDGDRYVIANRSVVIDATGKTTYIELANENISSIVASDNGLFVINNKYLWTVANGASVIPFLESEENVEVKCVSNDGWIVGVQNGTLVRWDSIGNRFNLGAGDAMDINSMGQIVGSINNQAVMWDANGSITYLPMLDGYLYSSAAAINDNGWIAGTAWYNGQPTEMAVLWEPVPEPSSILALFCGIGGIGGMILRKRKLN